VPGACSDGCWLGNGERGVDRFCGPVSISHKEPSTTGRSCERDKPQIKDDLNCRGT